HAHGVTCRIGSTRGDAWRANQASPPAQTPEDLTMAVSLGAQPEHGFDQPLGLLQDCHRRIEKFLGVLLRITRETHGSELSEEYAEALAASLRYFRNAAPWHTRDEEESLFPRMRVRPEPSVADALAMIARLES